MFTFGQWVLILTPLSIIIGVILIFLKSLKNDLAREKPINTAVMKKEEGLLNASVERDIIAQKIDRLEERIANFQIETNKMLTDLDFKISKINTADLSGSISVLLRMLSEFEVKLQGVKNGPAAAADTSRLEEKMSEILNVLKECSK